MKTAWFILTVVIPLCAMQQTVDPLVNLNQEPIIKAIIHYAADQRDNALKFENFKAFIKFRRVNKTWKEYVDEKYSSWRSEEARIVDTNWEQDFEEVKHNPLVGIMFNKSFNNLECNLPMSINAAIKRNLLFFVHRIWTYPRGKAALVQKLWLVGDNPPSYHEQENTIYPITLAVYLDSQPVIKLLKALYKDDEDIKRQLADAIEEKKKFDPAMFYLSGGEFRY